MPQDTINSIEIEGDDAQGDGSKSDSVEKSDEALPSTSTRSDRGATSIKLHNTASSRRQQYKSLKQKRSTSNIQLQQPLTSSKLLHRQVSLDSDKIGMGSEGNNSNFHPSSSRHYHHHHHHHFHNKNQGNHPKNMKNSDFELYLESETAHGNDYTTKSALQLTGDDHQNRNHTQGEKAQHTTPIRRDSSSTMSALQLPTSTSASTNAPSTSGLSKSRRHSNITGNNSGNNRQMRITSMRRIKSAALETSCPSVSNLTPHPISVEVIDGKTIRNPENTVLPPPSKFLSRNPPLNLFPNSSAAVQSCCTSSSATTISDMNFQHVASDTVYPIAEQGDENRKCKTSESCSSDDEDATDDKEGGDDEDDNLQHDEDDVTSNDGDSGLEREEINLSESEDEKNRNGSRSPLLEAAPPPLAEKKSPEKEVKPPESAVIKQRSASEEKRTRWFDSLDFGFNSTADSTGEISIDKSEDDKKTQKDENRTLSSSISASQISTGRSLSGAIPKQHGHHHRSGIAIRKLSFGEEQYPTSRMYQRTLSQRSTSDRIPENNAIQSTSTLPGLQLIRYLNNHPIEQHMLTPQIFLPGSGQHLYENQASLSSFRPRIIESHTQRRLRFGRSSYTFDLNFSTSSSQQQQPKERQNFVIVDSTKSPTSNDCDMCLDLPDGLGAMTSNSTNNARMLSGSQQNAGFIDNSDFNCFIDEQGHWINLMADHKAQPGQHTISSNISQIQQQHMLSSAFNNNNNNNSLTGNLNSYRIMTAAQSAEFSALSSAQSVDIQRNIFNDQQARPKIYKFPIRVCGMRLGKTIKITMNRLQLLALFDKDQNVYQIIFAIALSTFVAVLGSLVLVDGFYNDIFAFFFCFTIAGSQYSLLKSVQPDASSPIHGYNKTVTFSRPIYFCLLTSLMLICHYASESLIREEKMTSFMAAAAAGNQTSSSFCHASENYSIYGIVINWKDLFISIKAFLHWIILSLPLAFSIGLFPQINTFLMYFCEQIDMHVFGGNAVCNLIAGFLVIFRSLLACLILYGPIYGGLVEAENTQHILVSMFCGMLIPMCYHLSRNSSDFTYLFQLIKSTLLLHNDDDICGDLENGSSSKNEDNESQETTEDSSKDNTNLTSQTLDDPLPKKLQATVTARLKNDLVVCTFLGLLFFILHTSTFFTVLRSELNHILVIIAIILGFSLHYIVPQMRKHLPCLCVAAPILRAHEHGLFEVNRLSKIMWFEKAYVILSFVERNLLFPLIIISAITADGKTITCKYGNGLGSALIVITSIKGKF